MTSGVRAGSVVGSVTPPSPTSTMRIPRTSYLLVVCLLGWSNPGGGQASSGTLQRIFTVDGHLLPDALSAQCGRQLSGMPGFGATAALRWQGRGPLIVQADTRVALVTMPGGCSDDIPIVPGRNGVLEFRPGVEFDAGTPTAPFVASTLRVGARHDVGSFRFALLGGGGLIWRTRLLPLASVGLSAQVRRPGRALYLELDRTQVWLWGTETRTATLPGAGGAGWSVTRTVRRQLRPVWPSLRIGVAIARRGARPRDVA